MSDRPTLDDLTSDQLDALYRELEHTHLRARTLVRRLADAKAERDVRQDTIDRVRALAVSWQRVMRPGEPHPAATALLDTLGDQPGAEATEATEHANSAREVIAAAIYEHNNPGHLWADAHPDDRIGFGGDADAVLAVILPGTRAVASLARRADADVQRVIALYEQWVQAGWPPLGTSLSRWWDARLVEFHDAILPPAETNKEQG